jgi:4-carboxymuconolactone decarboxylase
MTEQQISKGRALLEQMAGGRIDAAEERWRAIHPDLADLILGFVAGEMWARPGLDLRSRSLVTIASTAALNRKNALELNIKLGLGNGLTREEIVEAMLHLGVYAGFPAAWDGLETAMRVFAEQDARWEPEAPDEHAAEGGS